MNKRALRANVTKIEKAVQNPKKFFDMTTWAHRVLHPDTLDYCGTACCFAGWAAPAKLIAQEVVSFGSEPSREIVIRAQQKFDITREQGDLLFDAYNWPDRFKQRYNLARDRARKHVPGTKRRIKAELAKVKVLRDRVEHFIATEGRE